MSNNKNSKQFNKTEEQIENEECCAHVECSVQQEQNPNESDTQQPTENILDEKDKIIEQLRTALAEAQDTILRVKADAENFKKRLTKEFDEKLKFANQSLLMDFIAFADNVEIAMSHIQKSDDETVCKIIEGFELILKQFKDILAKHGMREIDCQVGDSFDPNKHEALMLDAREDFENNAITMVLQKGYTLNDRVIRPTKVKVNKK
ncbi:MAG: nucleotide exchange factor GrpE [Calditerrivibrio sp.]|nr:nucleotide exchange factor GrpE [Calditerrivibrio sp.]